MLFGSSPVGGFVASGCAGATGSVVAAGAVDTGTPAAASSFATSSARSSSRLGPLEMSFMGVITFLPTTLAWADSSGEATAVVAAVSGTVNFALARLGGAMLAGSGTCPFVSTGGSSLSTTFSLGGAVKVGGSCAAAAKFSTAVANVASLAAAMSRLSGFGVAGANVVAG